MRWRAWRGRLPCNGLCWRDCERKAANWARMTEQRETGWRCDTLGPRCRIWDSFALNFSLAFRQGLARLLFRGRVFNEKHGVSEQVQLHQTLRYFKQSCKTAPLNHAVKVYLYKMYSVFPNFRSFLGYSNFLQRLIHAHAGLARHHLGPYLVAEDLCFRQGCPVGAWTNLEPLEVVHLVPLVFGGLLSLGHLFEGSVAVHDWRGVNGLFPYIMSGERRKTHP
jgi:hypothetical protein